MNGTIDDKRLVGFGGEPFGTAGQRLETPQGAVVLVHRAEDLGGGIIVLPASELEDRAEEIVAPYGELSIREAPPYSSDVPLDSYLRFWKRLGASNSSQTESEYLTADSGPVAGPPSSLTDDQIAELVKDGLQRASGVSPPLSRYRSGMAPFFWRVINPTRWPAWPPAKPRPPFRV